MFYSQFILAKKGPLGTIWIAAHLERKLRKNQVADTDIGDSVDSILSPDVPIALRLSSHLLLGVVRIYNRKVNYLFDDCSEALLKVKQAFRSTAVDLPPEESKAPYHSITLPEKFDLDDFELPDSDIFQGNYVDHHISSREQITLQDTMEGVSYSTSKFGLDERFGDADTSGLDLDEELFLGKIDTEGHADERADPHTSFGSTLPVKQDQQAEDRAADSEVMVDHGNEFVDVMDYEHAPCTPGLVAEPNLSNIQDASACDDHLESEYQVMESTKMENPKSTPYEGKQEVDWCSRDDAVSHDLPQGPSEVNGCLSGVLEVNESMPQGEFPVEVISDEVMKAPDNVLQKDALTEAASEDHAHILSVDENCYNNQGPNEMGWEKSYSGISGLVDQQVSEDKSAKDLTLLGDEVPGNMGDSNQPKSLHGGSEFALENQVGFVEIPETQVFEGTTGSSALNLTAHDKEAASETPFLRPCNFVQENADLTKSGTSCSFNDDLKSDGTALPADRGEEIENPGELFCVNVDSEHNLAKNHVQGLPSGENIEAATSEADVLVHTTYPQDSLLLNLNNPAESVLPTPEKLLSVAEGQMDLNESMMVEGSPVVVGGFDEGDAGSKTAAGRKRSFTESTLTEQSLYSVESSRQVRAKQSAVSVPNDDDLLSSILVGRSSVLKVKPTPPHYEVTSMKRTRSAPRPRAPKRKVLMDDTMVLHGDSIRQQLTYTEDIRRVRKKAPCTLPEISMIHQKQLEDEIFLQPIFTGMSVDLVSLHSQVYDLSRISVSQNEVNDSSVDILTEPRLPSQKDESYVSPELQPNFSSHPEMVGASLETRPELQFTPANNRNQGVEDDNGPGEINVRKMSQQGLNHEFYTVRDNETAEPSVNQLPSENKPVQVDDINIASPLVDPEVQPFGSSGCATGDMGDAAIISDQKEATLSVELDYADLYYGEAIVRSEVRERDGYAREEGETELGENGSILPDTTQDVTPIELGYHVQSEICNTTSIEQKDLNYEEAIVRNEVRENDGYAKEDGETDLGEKDGILPDMTQDAPPIDLGYPAQSELCSTASQEQQEVEFSCRELETMMLHDGFINNSENPDRPESNEPNMMDAGVSGFDLHDRDEVDYWAAANDTDFLNVDDDDLNEMADDHMPDDEEARFAENSGWSSRTRAVSKYLQAAFVKEADYGRKSLSLDSLLIGKSRKEASRMFFETLVLKTRDYIHVEQRNPFDDLAIKPRTRLMKSQF